MFVKIKQTSFIKIYIENNKSVKIKQKFVKDENLIFQNNLINKINVLIMS